MQTYFSLDVQFVKYYSLIYKTHIHSEKNIYISQKYKNIL